MYAFYYVPGLSFYTTEKGLSEHFSQYGQVVEGNFGYSFNNIEPTYSKIVNTCSNGV